jgi:cytochrome c oxidase subunit 3
MSETISADIKKPSKTSVFDDYNPAVRIRTKKMLMYLIIFAVVMIFAGLTSAYIVINAGKYWVHVDPPNLLTFSTIFLALSSVTFYLALKFTRNGNQQTGLGMIALTFILGLVFTITQYQGWQELSDKGMGFTIREENGVKISSWNRISGIKGEYGKDFYVHKDGERLIFENGQYYAPDDVLRSSPLTYDVEKTSNLSSSFIAVLLILHVLHLSFGLLYLIVLAIRSARGIINSGNTISLYTGGIYWHFLGILWLYLFLFLFFIH